MSKEDICILCGYTEKNCECLEDNMFTEKLINNFFKIARRDIELREWFTQLSLENKEKIYEHFKGGSRD